MNDLFRKVTKLVLKYTVKTFIYSAALYYIYQLFYEGIVNNIHLTFSFFLKAVIPITSLFMTYDAVAITQNINRVVKPTKLMACEIKEDDRVRKIKAYHEAGHAVMAKFFQVPIKEISITSKGHIGGQVVLELPSILKASELKNIVMIKYSGFVSEKIFLNEASNGCMGTVDSDMETANEAIKQYIILSDTSISLTGYENDYIEKKSIELSMDFLKDVEKILLDNKEDIEKMAQELLKD